MSLSDIIVFYENKIIPIQAEIGSLSLESCNDLYFVYPENVLSFIIYYHRSHSVHLSNSMPKSGIIDLNLKKRWKKRKRILSKWYLL